MLHEKLTNICGAVAALTGGTGFCLSADIAPADVSAWFLMLTSGVTAFGGALLVLYGQAAKARREAKLADDEAFAKTKEAEIARLKDRIADLVEQNKARDDEIGFLKDKVAFLERKPEGKPG